MHLSYGLYARKSKDDKSGAIKSIQDQLDICRELAARIGLSIKAEYEENKSARTPGVRPLYKAMVQDLRRGRINAILVWHVNRLGRNMEEAGQIAQMLIDGLIQEIRTPFAVFKPGDNILPLILEQGMSAQYSLDLSRTIRLSMDSMVKAGGWPHQAKLGYLNARDPLTIKRGIIVPDPDRFELTRRGFDLMLSGTRTVRQVIDEMNSWGLQTRPTPTRPGGSLSYALGYDMFRNPFYAGFIRHNGVVRKGNHEPMITLPEFNRLQQIMERHVRSRQRRNVFAYTGMMTCGYCGLQVTAERHYKSGKWRTYYHCSDTYNRCTKRGINEENLEREIVRWLDSITVDPLLCQIALESLADGLSAQSASTGAVLARQHQAMVDVESQRDNLLDLMLRGVITDEEKYRQKEARLLAERNRLQLASVETLEALEHLREQARRGFEFVKLARDAFMAAELDLKKEIAQALGVRYVLRGNELEVTIDPLLVEIVRFVDEIMVRLEPGVEGSQSRYRASFKPASSFGRGALCVVEPPEPLLKALRGPLFGDVFASHSWLLH